MADNEQRIRERAYQLWEQAGCPHGRDGEFWLTAQAELAAPKAAPQPVASKTAVPKAAVPPKASSTSAIPAKSGGAKKPAARPARKRSKPASP